MMNSFRFVTLTRHASQTSFFVDNHLTAVVSQQPERMSITGVGLRHSLQQRKIAMRMLLESLAELAAAAAAAAAAVLKGLSL